MALTVAHTTSTAKANNPAYDISANAWNGTGAHTISIATALSPDSDGGAALGTSTVRWSNLFLATGAAIDWNNGNIKLNQTSGALGVNGTYASTFGLTPVFQVNAITGQAAQGIHGWGVSGDLYFGRSDGAIGVQTLVAASAKLSYISWAGSNGTNFAEAAALKVSVDGTATASSMPGKLDFYTTPSGTLTPVIRLSIYNDGSVITSGPVSVSATTTAQALRVYNTTDSNTSPTNYERGVFDWTTSANVLTIGTQAGGTGTARPLQFVSGSTVIGDYGVSSTNTWTFTAAGTAATVVAYNTSSTHDSQIVCVNNLNQILTHSCAFGYSGTATGAAATNGPTGEQGFQGTVGNFPFTFYANSVALLTLTGGGAVNLAQAGVFGWSSSATNTGAAADTGLTRTAANVVEINNGTAGTLTGCYLHWGGQARVTSDFNTGNSTTLTNVTGLSVTVAAGRTYQFETELYLTDAAAGGAKAAIGGTATATAINYTGYMIADNAIKAKTNATALATAVASSVTTETSGIVIRITGTITVNAGGTLTVQLAQNTGNATGTVAKQGSYFIVHDMP